MKRMSTRTRLGLEHLENRTVPALLLQLDAAGNLTTIFGVPSGDVDVTLTAADEVNVVENGNDLGTYSVPGNLSINLGNALAPIAVTVDLAGAGLSGSLSINAGNSLGGYAVSVLDGTLDGSLTVRSGSGPDTANVDGVTVGGNAYVDLRNGVDDITINATAIEGSLTAGNAGLLIGGESTIGGFLSFFLTESVNTAVTLEAGSSVAGSASFRFGAGSDSLVLDGDILGNVSANFANGFNLYGGIGTIGSNLAVTSGNQDDLISLDGTILGNVTASTGGGADNIETGFNAPATVLGNAITLIAGNGDDIFTNTDLTAPGARLTFLGGSGDDFVDWSAAIPLLLSGYLDGGFGNNTADLSGGVIAFPFIIRNFG